MVIGDQVRGALWSQVLQGFESYLRTLDISERNGQQGRDSSRVLKQANGTLRG